MKYIKNFEKVNKIDYSDLVDKYFQKLYYTFFLLKKKPNNMFMCKMLNIDHDFINWEEYDYDDLENSYQVTNKSLHIRDFDKYYIIKTFDTFDEMKKEYEIFKNADKYNL